MLRKIDCIMIRVDDVQAAAAYYANVFGLRPQWSGDDALDLSFQRATPKLSCTTIQIFPRRGSLLPG